MQNFLKTGQGSIGFSIHQAIGIFVHHRPIKWVHHRLPYPCATKSDFDRVAYGLGNPSNPECAEGGESNGRAGMLIHRRDAEDAEKINRMGSLRSLRLCGESYFFAFAICSFAAVTTPSRVKPNFFDRSLRGAEAPKVFMPIVLPVLPTYLCQPKVPAASTLTRAVTCGGRTLLRYASSCSSNSSQLGIETTRDFTPSARSFSCACTHKPTSVPVPMRMTSGVVPQQPTTYAPFATPAAELYLVRSRVGISWRERTRQTGWCLRFMMTRQASATSLPSPGRITIRPGMARSD